MLLGFELLIMLIKQMHDRNVFLFLLCLLHWLSLLGRVVVSQPQGSILALPIVAC